MGFCDKQSPRRSGDIAQLVRAPALQAGGLLFESGYPHHLVETQKREANGFPFLRFNIRELLFQFSCSAVDRILFYFLLSALGLHMKWYRFD